MRWTVLPTPVHDLLIAADEHGICAVGFDGGRRDHPAGRQVRAAEDPLLHAAAEQFAGYFAGELTAFTLPLSVRRGGDFERAVWAEMVRIPYGETRTYGQLAASVRTPPGGSLGQGAPAAPDGTGAGGFAAARAVGVACNRNPLPIVVPCHRVVGAGGKLVGFGGGLPRKRFLLELEARVSFERMLTC